MSKFLLTSSNVSIRCSWRDNGLFKQHFAYQAPPTAVEGAFYCFIEITKLHIRYVILLQPPSFETKRIRNYRDAGEGHRQAGKNGVEHNAPDWVKHTGGNRNTNHVINKGPEKILLNRSHCPARELKRLRYFQNIAIE